MNIKMILKLPTFVEIFEHFFSLLVCEMFKTRLQMDKSDFTRFKT